MKKKWCIVLKTGNGFPLLVEDDNGNGALFDSEEEAEKMAASMPITRQWLYVIVEMP